MGPEVVGQLVAPDGGEGENTDEHDVRVLHVGHVDAGDGLAVHIGVVHQLLDNGSQGVESHGGGAYVAVVDEVVEGRGLVGAVARLKKTDFHRIPPRHGGLGMGSLFSLFYHFVPVDTRRGRKTVCLGGKPLLDDGGRAWDNKKKPIFGGDSMINRLVRLFIQDCDNVTDPAVREKYGVLSGAVGIVLNLLLSAGKFFAGVVTGSIAITADAFNNLSDAGSSVVTLVGFKLAGQKADDGHPFGHGRAEYLAGLLVSLMILLVGLELGKTSIGKILRPEAVDFSLVSVAILAASILVKLWMSHFNRVLGKKLGSAAMAATAADSLSDVVATSAVLAGTLAGHFAHLSIDGWAGAVVAVFILKAGWGAAKDTINPLLGASPDPELVHAIREVVLSHPQVVGMHDLIIHDYGPGRRLCSFHAEVPQDADILEAHDAIDHIEREIQQKFGIETTAHMDPIATDDESVNRLREQVAALARAVEPEMTIHDFRVTKGPQHTNLIFDVVVPHRCRLRDEELCERLSGAVRALDERYFAVIQVDRAYVETR